MRYNRADFSSTAGAARRLSESDGRLRFVQANANGYCIALRRLPSQQAWWTNGEDCGLWEAGAPSGRSQHQIARELADRLQETT